MKETKKGIDKLAYYYKEELNLNVTRIIYFDRIIETEAEMLEDETYNHIFDEFVNSDKSFRQRNPSQEFTAYVSGKKVFTAYTIDGIKMFREVAMGCCIDNCPFNEIVLLEDGAIKIQRNWEKSTANRKALKALGHRICS